MDESDTYTGDTYGMDAPDQSMPPRAWARSGGSNTLNVAKAQRIIKAFTDDPSWLADPRTAHAANSVFSAASKVVGMNIQLERLNAMSESARARTSTANKVGSSLLNLAEGGGEGAKWASQWYAQGDDGKPLYENPSNWSKILEGFETHSIEKKGVAPTDVQLLYFAKQYRDEGDLTNATRLEAIVEERGRNKGQPSKIDKAVTVTTDDLLGNKVTRKMTEEEFNKSEANKPLSLDTETKSQLSEYAEEKAAISTGDTAKGPDWLGLSNRARNLNELKTKLTQKGIDADTGRKIGAPEPAETIVEETQILTDPTGNQVKVPKSRVAELMGKGYR